VFGALNFNLTQNAARSDTAVFRLIAKRMASAIARRLSTAAGSIPENRMIEPGYDTGDGACYGKSCDAVFWWARVPESWPRIVMCRNIKTLHNFKPPATDDEIRASSLQFVRKLSGFTSPSKANQLAFDRAVEQVAEAAHELLDSLVTNAPPRYREVEAAKARARAADRFR
jgi:hypothetical protein